MIELGVQVIATDEDREAIVRKVVLEPRLINPLSRRSGDVADALCIAGERAGLATVDPQSVQPSRPSGLYPQKP